MVRPFGFVAGMLRWLDAQLYKQLQIELEGRTLDLVDRLVNCDAIGQDREKVRWLYQTIASLYPSDNEIDGVIHNALSKVQRGTRLNLRAQLRMVLEAGLVHVFYDDDLLLQLNATLDRLE